MRKFRKDRSRARIAGAHATNLLLRQNDARSGRHDIIDGVLYVIRSSQHATKDSRVGVLDAVLRHEKPVAKQTPVGDEIVTE